MSTPIFYAIGSVVIVSLMSLVGIFVLATNERRLRMLISPMVALAVGALLGDAFIHLIPETFTHTKNAVQSSLLIIGGMLLFFILEKVLHLHHHGHDTHEENSHKNKSLGHIILISDGLHNFIDGVIIAASYLVSIEVGIATTGAIILHEIPQEIGDFGVLIHAGYTKTQAILVNFYSASFAVAGSAITLFANRIASATEAWIVPLAIGVFIYTASSDLVPELHKQTGIWNIIYEIIGISIGVGAMYALLFLE
ncbi:MAG: ZIP family metal transporter [Candidatus Ryanbacteria bacterium CG10_big_fil_rev_8_21_14_0_10_43_42]|uniref:ZIP family metal transporter n=1 Tax=Candidatus Ryanbacteria bacterium CG10_big_fil_rev_8_21_14_0_10_43_42 TaxID=1974864 RepID=A0A2M8KXH6_9BACT|nr:MAG: ZIP family metal transporter [Candidatus Ryanbacteria bacterium CG10_big_fil_rev_8_21_14_0_10_43_42]